MKKAVDQSEDLSLRSILLVEDDPLIAANQIRLLQRGGYRVTALHSADEAISGLHATPYAWDLVLMDIDLGDGKDGPDTARELLAIHHVPIVFLSAHSEKAYVDRTLGIESYGFVAKNAGITVLLTSIAMAFRLWDARQKQHAEERQYRVLVESSPDIIMRFDRQHHYLYVSPSVRLLGPRPPGDFIGKTLE